MASSALEEKINKIRLQNEEIRRRYEEVEADKQHAAKLNALVQLVPSDDWPERKEPPEFSAPPKNTQSKKALTKEHNDNPPPHFSRVQERLARNNHKISQGDGPPPDPKYNFLADSEREMHSTDDFRGDNDNRNKNKMQRGAMRRRGGGSGGHGGSGGRDAFFKDNRGPNAFHSKGDSLPEYEAWRAERNKIDEARINRQKTADGAWRREWDCNKVNIEKDTSRKSEYNRKDSGNFERRNNFYDNDYSRGHAGNRTFHGSQKNQDYPRRPHFEQSQDYKKQSDDKMPVSPNDDRHVSATDKSIKVTVNHGSQASGPVMSVKVNSPSIAGTGRVGPRQKSRVTYSSQSDVEVTTHEIQSYARQSFDEKATRANFNDGQKTVPKSPFSQRKKESNSKAYPQKKEFKNDESKSSVKSIQLQKSDTKDLRQPNNYVPRPQRVQKQSKKLVPNAAENVPLSNNAVVVENNADKSLKDESYAEQSFNNESNQSDNTFNQSNVVNEAPLDSCENFNDLQSNLVNEQFNNVLDNNSIEESDFKSLENDVFCDIGEYNEKLLTVEDNESCKNNENIQPIESIETNNISKNGLQEDIIDYIKTDEIIVNVELKTNVECAQVDENVEDLKINENIEMLKVEDNEENIENNSSVDVIETKEEYKKSEHDKEDEKVYEDKQNVMKTESNIEKLLPTTESKAEMVEQQSKSCESSIEETDQNVAIENVNVSKSENIEEYNSVVKEKNEEIRDQENNFEEIKEDNFDEAAQVIVSIENKENEVTDNLKDKSKNEFCQNIEDIKSQETFEVNDNLEINETTVKKMTTENEVADNLEDKASNQTCQKIEDLKSQEASEIKDNIKSNEKPSDFVEEKDNSLKEINVTNVDNHHNESVNDSGFIDDSITESDAKDNVEQNFEESVKSNVLDVTKEISEKTLEICDIHSADSSEISQPIQDLIKENEKIQEVIDTLENSTKENKIEIFENINKNLEPSKLADIQKETENQPTEIETSVKEIINTSTEEVKID